MAGALRRIDPDEVNRIRELLKSRGVRATPARIAVLQELRATSQMQTHAELSEKLVPLGFDKATVFRTLGHLVDAGLLSRKELGDHVWHFEVIDPENPDSDKHPHFVCVDCGDVLCLGDMKFTSSSRKQEGRIGRITEILIKGHCADCESAAS